MLPLGRQLAYALAAALAAAVLSSASVSVSAGTPEPFKPEVGQAGQDVIWVPTPARAVERMLALARVGPDDFLIDLGSGDGRIVIAAARRWGARGFGVDLNPDMVRLSEHRAREAGVSDRAKFYVRDIFKTDLREASVVTLYLLPELNLRLRPQLLKLVPGTRIVANAFDMGEWEADEVDTTTASMLRLWVVPADVAGHWSWSFGPKGHLRSFELDINQQFQRISGVVTLGQQRLRLRNPKLKGSELSFVLLEQQRADHGVRSDYVGRVKGDVIEGEMTGGMDGKRLKWTAKRRARAGSNPV
ncbi:MAG: class I SAM-dependent methyltransferase [Betaproteobacteria bacterium]|nr:MAG: class I SAM-dependent methyltransferase [Betaproteobacteria bacterium]